MELNHQEFQVPKMEESWTLFSAILGVGFPLHKGHKLYPYSSYRLSTSILGTWNFWFSTINYWEVFLEYSRSPSNLTEVVMVVTSKTRILRPVV